MDTLRPFFEPKSVVVIGASRNEKKLGFGVTRNLIESGYSGEIFLVNTKGGELFNRRIYTSIDQLNSSIELALIVVQAHLVPETLIACSHKKIKNIIIHTSGFSEIGTEGLLLENTCKKIAKEEGLKVLGPNCVGIIDTHFPIDTTFIPPPIPKKGKIALITQSGALGAAMIDLARGEDVGFSRLVSLGNQMDVDESDALGITAEGNSTKSVMMYLESIQNGPKFLKQATKVSEKKPIIALKAGHSKAGKKAALSHTGALAGSDTAYSAAFRRARVLQAMNTREMFAWAHLLASSPEPMHNRVAILTNAGGPGVIASDAVEGNDLEMAKFSYQTIEKLTKVLPAAASINNPVDMLASASPKIFSKCLRILLEDENVDMVSVIAPPPPMYSALEIADHLIEIIQSTDKPVVISFMGNRLVKEATIRLKEYSIPEFTYPEEGINGLAALWKNKLLQTQDQTPLYYPQKENKKNLLRTSFTERSKIEKVSTNDVTEKLLNGYEIPILSLYHASDEESAVILASQIGYPIVMKIYIDGVSHKSDIDGIIIDLRSEEDVRIGFRELKYKALKKVNHCEFKGVHLQKMVNYGQEVIVGAVRDQVFGPMIMFGSGGVDVEGVQDIEFALAPITRGDLDYLFAKTWAGKKLKGFRQNTERDISAVQDILIKISQMMIDYPEIMEIEINPLIVAEKTRGAIAVDARLITYTSTEKE